MTTLKYLQAPKLSFRMQPCGCKAFNSLLYFTTTSAKQSMRIGQYKTTQTGTHILNILFPAGDKRGRLFEYTHHHHHVQIIATSATLLLRIHNVHMEMFSRVRERKKAYAHRSNIDFAKYIFVQIIYMLRGQTIVIGSSLYKCLIMRTFWSCVARAHAHAKTEKSLRR